MPGRTRERAATQLDVEEQKQRLGELIDSGKKHEALNIVSALLRKLLDENQELVQDMNQLLKKHLGQTSERISSTQLSLFLKLAGMTDAEIENILQGPSEIAARCALLGAGLAFAPAAALAVVAGVEVSSLTRRQRINDDEARSRSVWPFAKRARGHGRLEFPPDAPRIEVEVEPPAAEKWCNDCGVEKRRRDFSTTETLEREPAHYKVIVHKCWSYECARCEARVAAFAPTIIEKGSEGRACWRRSSSRSTWIIFPSTGSIECIFEKERIFRSPPCRTG